MPVEDLDAVGVLECELVHERAQAYCAGTGHYPCDDRIAGPWRAGRGWHGAPGKGR
jgi:hypothetical protein